MLERRLSFNRDNSPLGTVNGTALTSFFTKARTRRVDWIDLADSNEVFGGFGRNHGIQYALQNNGFHLYGSGLSSGNENNGFGAQYGYFWFAANNGSRPNNNGSIPAGLNVFNQITVGSLTGPQFYQSYPWSMSDAQSDSTNQGIYLNPGGPIPVTSPLRVWYRYGNLTSGSGQFQTAVRRQSAPFTQLAVGPVVNTGASGANDLVTSTLSIPQDLTRNYPIDFRWGSNAFTIQGPVYFLWIHVDATNITAGVQYSTMVSRGGEGLFEFIQCVQASAPGVQEYLRCACEAQTGAPTALICVNSGFNDRNDAANNSLGPVGGLPSNTAAGYADNMRGIIIAIENAWAALGYARSDLYFLLQPSHPLSSPDDADLIGYRNACAGITSEYENTASSNLFTFWPELNANAAAWYNDASTDRLHMKAAGYEQFINLWIKDLVRGA